MRQRLSLVGMRPNYAVTVGDCDRHGLFSVVVGCREGPVDNLRLSQTCWRKLRACAMRCRRHRDAAPVANPLSIPTVMRSDCRACLPLEVSLAVGLIEKQQPQARTSLSTLPRPNLLLRVAQDAFSVGSSQEPRDSPKSDTLRWTDICMSV